MRLALGWWRGKRANPWLGLVSYHRERVLVTQAESCLTSRHSPLISVKSSDCRSKLIFACVTSNHTFQSRHSISFGKTSAEHAFLSLRARFQPVHDLMHIKTLFAIKFLYIFLGLFRVCIELEKRVFARLLHIARLSHKTRQVQMQFI